MVQTGWKEKAHIHELKIQVGGVLPLGHFNIVGKEDSLVYKTYFIQEMLKRGYIASNAFYTSFAHSPEIIKEYLEHVDEIFGQISDIMKNGKRVEAYLEKAVCHSGFGRLN